MTEEQKTILEKIKKLFGLSKSANQHEAELALQRANELMTKYQISYSEVDLQELESGKSAIIRERHSLGNKARRIWIDRLAAAVAQLYDGMLLLEVGRSQSFTFVGYPQDVVLMKATFDHLYSSWESFVEIDLQAAKANRSNWRARDTTKFKLGHGQGYTAALHTRIARLVKERETAVTQATGSAIVLLKRKAVEEDLEEFQSVRRKQAPGSSSGYGAGYASGFTVPLGGALEGQTPALA